METGDTIKQLKEIAYTYYPFGINDSDQDYYNSPQYLHLKETKQRRVNLMIDNWDALVRNIAEQSDKLNIIIEDWKEIVPINNCFKLVVIANDTAEDMETRIRLVLNLSILIPYYLIHQSIVTPESKVIHKGDYSSVAYNVPKQVHEIHSVICSLLHRYFPVYNPLLQKIAEEPIDEIVFDGRGNISGYYLSTTRRMTIFNAFFSNNFL